MKKTILYKLFIVLIFPFVSSCISKGNQTLQQTDTPIPIAKAGSAVIAEGKIVPNQSVDLSFQFSGTVSEVLVREGDFVNVGDVIARLGNREQVEAEVANAEVNVVTAQQIYDDLFKNHALDVAKALDAVAKANKKVRDAQYQLDNFTIPVGQQNLDAIEGIQVTEQKLDEARKAFEPYKNDSLLDDNREKLKENLDNAQADYNAAVKRLSYEVTLQYAKAELQLALRNWQAIQSGPDPEQLSLAKDRLAAAQAALTAARAHLDNLELKAPISGTVSKLDLVVGDQVATGLMVATIADFSSWFVETDNITELDVVKIKNKQPVRVVADALPNVSLRGIVEYISQEYVERRGDITYTTKIRLLDSDPNLRWGMTVLVTFE